MRLPEILQRAAEPLELGRAFGPAYERDDCTVIPVAFVAGGGGGGTGPGEQGGTGFGGVTWPLGVYVVSGGRARWVPAVDATLVVLAALAVLRRIAGRRR